MRKSGRAALPGRFAAALLAGTCLSGPAWAADILVNSDAMLRSAIQRRREPHHADQAVELRRPA